jgi:acyl-ACP thioesterase
MTLDKVLMPVLDGHPDVFERESSLRVADIDRCGRLRLDAAARHIQDIGQDQLRELGFADTHPLWIVRRIMIDLIKPIEFNDTLHQRRPQGLHCTTNVHRLRWTSSLTPGNRENATQIRYYPVRFTDTDLFNHMNNSAYWSVVEDYLSATPELLRGPCRVTIEHEAPIALGDKLEIIAHVHPAGSTDKFGPGLVDRTVTTLTYANGDETKAIASIFAL